MEQKRELCCCMSMSFSSWALAVVLGLCYLAGAVGCGQSEQASAHALCRQFVYDIWIFGIAYI